MVRAQPPGRTRLERHHKLASEGFLRDPTKSFFFLLRRFPVHSAPTQMSEPKQKNLTELVAAVMAMAALILTKIYLVKFLKKLLAEIHFSNHLNVEVVI